MSRKTKKESDGFRSQSEIENCENCHIDDIINKFGRIDIINYDHPDEHIPYRNRHPLAPQWPFRMLFCGPSGCGKTMAVLNLIYDFLEYDTISVYSATLEKANYQELREHIEDIEKCTGTKISFFSDKLEDVIPLDKLDPNKQNLVIFDDFCTEKDQRMIVDYFIKGRHYCTSSIYISQTYNLCPSNIRRNCNYFAFYDIGNGRDEYAIIVDHIRGIDNKEFRSLFREAKSEPYSFLLVDKKTKDKRLRYRKKFDEPLG